MTSVSGDLLQAYLLTAAFVPPQWWECLEIPSVTAVSSYALLLPFQKNPSSTWIGSHLLRRNST
jgi:hypothetical protein